MSRGFITIAQNSESGDYVRAAYALALSLRMSGNHGLSIVVDDLDAVPEPQRAAFDEIIPLPQDDARGEWKVHNKWQVHDLTPYDETILVDADMLFTVDISDWWDLLGRRDFWVCTEPVNFRNQTITESPYRDDFVRNELPMAYTAFAYFRRGAGFCRELFDAVRTCYQHWGAIRLEYFTEKIAESVSGDLAFATALKMIDAEFVGTRPGLGFPTFVHMKGQLMNLDGYGSYEEDWRKHVRAVLLPDGNLMVNNFVQRFPFHYHIKDWLTDETVGRLEEMADATG